VVGLILFAIVVVGLIFVTTASYSRLETVTGSVVLDRGVASVVPPRGGVVARVLVREGQTVEAGTPLVAIAAGESMTGGGTVAARIVGAVEQQDAQIAAQAQLVRAAGAAERGRVAEQVAGLQRELSSIAEQIRTQQRLVEVAQQELSDVQRIAGGGFVSRRDVNAREGVLLTRQQQLAQLRQVESARAAALQEARRNLQQIAASPEATVAGLQSSRSALTQQAAEAEAGRGYTLVAAVPGTVTALTGRVGQPVQVDRPLMTIIPRGAQPTVEMQVPTSAAAFRSEARPRRVPDIPEQWTVASQEPDTYRHLYALAW
jgi:membrane fusion protein